MSIDKRFEKTSEVRAYLRQVGIATKFKVTKIQMDRQDYFEVTPATPKGVAVASRTESEIGTLFFSDDAGVTAQAFQTIHRVLKNTNAFTG